MRAIFISYRRDDAEGEAGRLFDDLVARFGEASVFMDVAAIQKGRDFRKAIDESIATCGVLLAVIGTKWVDAKNENGDRRLEDPFDFVRLEGAILVRELTDHYIVQVGDHPPGTTVIINKYRRITPEKP
jgi:hypothetical protein